MRCCHPLHGYKSRVVNPTGKRSLVFRAPEGAPFEPVSVPCGRCWGCRLELSRQWALRCVHESQLHNESSFITLTYDDEHLPYGGTLIKKHFQDFIKRVRRKYEGRRLGYFHCGEYGDRTRRPHYHALLFGVEFPDQTFFKRSADGSKIYTSDALQKLWGAGFCTTGAVTFESAAYVARYTMGKLNYEKEYDYEFIDLETGEVCAVQPEYTTMSLKPAIGKEWYRRFKTDAYPSDFVILKGKKMKPPQYYDRLHELEDPEAHERIKAARVKQAAGRRGGPHLAAEEEYIIQRVKQLKRGMT